jgi:hypothetical protein
MPDGYKKAWDDFRLRKRLFWALFLGYIPMWSLLALLVHGLGLPVKNQLMVALGLAWMLAWFVVGIWYPLFRCPRCGERFIPRQRRNPFFATFASKCANCGLGIDESPEPVAKTGAGR